MSAVTSEGFVKMQANAAADSPAFHAGTEMALREALLRKDAMLRRNEALLQQQRLLLDETDHRMLNDLQMIISLLSLQGRNSSDPETASQLNIAAQRVSMIVRVHQRLHALRSIETIAFNRYLEDLCADFSTMLSPQIEAVRVSVDKEPEIMLSTTKALRLSFIVCELLTNAAKHGTGPITVALESDRFNNFALCVANGGKALPSDFDPVRSTGLGMKIVSSFVAWLGGELRFGQGDGQRGARFTVLFSAREPVPIKQYTGAPHSGRNLGQRATGLGNSK
jgi:two-component sensor histidine kinase